MCEGGQNPGGGKHVYSVLVFEQDTTLHSVYAFGRSGKENTRLSYLVCCVHVCAQNLESLSWTYTLQLGLARTVHFFVPIKLCSAVDSSRGFLMSRRSKFYRTDQNLELTLATWIFLR